MTCATAGTVAQHTGYDGEIEEHPVYGMPARLTDDDVVDMRFRRLAAGITIDEANRERLADGLPPLGLIETSRRQTVYRVPSWQ